MKKLPFLIIVMLITATAKCEITMIHLNKDPVITPGFGGPFDNASVSDPEMIWDGTSIKLYYTAEDVLGVKRIALVESFDGQTWIARGVVLEPGVSGNFDDEGVLSPAVTFNGSIYEMYYTGISSGWYQIGRVESRDGYYFNRDQGQESAVLKGSYDPDRFDYLGVGHPGVTRVGDYLLMMYEGYDGTIWKRLGFAYSTDGHQFNKIDGDEGRSAFFGPGPHGFDDAGAYEPELMMVGNDLRFYYTSIHY